MATSDHETHDFDVIVIGAGGAGLRAAIEAKGRGLRTALVCKSLLGKAHTVMAEGGVAAAMGNVYPEDNWQVHFRDTMRGGKMLNNWRMAQLHAQEAPDRVHELEAWGALFDRTADGRILQRDFGGHRYARLAHVGDRTGLELIRTLQQKAVSMGIEVFMECKVLQLLRAGDGAVNGAVGYWRATGELVTFSAKAVVLASGGVGKSWKYTSNSWESTGDGHAMALWAGADLIDMECVQFHPTGMVWPLSVRGILVTEGVRGDGGVLRNSEGTRFMFGYVADMFRAETAESEAEGDRSLAEPLTRSFGRLTLMAQVVVAATALGPLAGKVGDVAHGVPGSDLVTVITAANPPSPQPKHTIPQGPACRAGWRTATRPLVGQLAPDFQNSGNLGGMAVARKKTALYLDEKLMQSAKLLATTSGKHDYEVIEEALREYVVARREEAGRRMHELLDEIAGWQERESVPRLTDAEAAALAASELHAVRAERRRR